jgi:hypothetical protein
MERSFVQLAEPFERILAEEPERGAAAYRNQGIVSVQSHLGQALAELTKAEAWARSCAALPVHVLPLVADLAGKARMVVREIEGMR